MTIDGEAPQEVDALIVGGGMAGCLLGQTLLGRGLRTALVEANLPNAASPVAAGILNPVVGPKLSATTETVEHLAAARRTYGMRKGWGAESYRWLYRFYLVQPMPSLQQIFLCQ